MAPARVGIIGCGIVGPAIATLLKQQGFDPIIFERNDAVPMGGIGLGVQSNGLAVLQRIPGLAESLAARQITHFHAYSALAEDTGVLAQIANAGHSVFGTKRSALQDVLVAAAERAQVPVRWGHHLKGLEQSDDAVTLRFANGAEETVSFVVGCDGLHSDTRKALFGDAPADYTGLVQIGGYSPKPAQYAGESIAMQIFGDGQYMVVISVDDDTLGWAITTREAEAKETWRNMDAAAAEAFKQTSPVAQWPFGAGDILRNAYGMIKYGLYDRPELPTWHNGRVVLIGDAAHPTSPHLGQGANQSFEDAGLLADLLAEHAPAGAAPPSAALATVFAALEAERIPRTAAVVKKARAEGEMRVVSGVQACIERNNFYRKVLNDDKLLRERFVHAPAKKGEGEAK
ncbi:FAD/NAD(P)-binding domain-containing protein [Phanerochaete sordida]|uniref:FAD/NAD(P)-binding domain-containing protein n=1 Tax=Phanerochaete sordida TaxID=48140 RepID=A0A9P3GHJ1_9APHY|nr:FAD/NAD(P)-binding domain-containing protein [Phanerochaete sordida]